MTAADIIILATVAVLLSSVLIFQIVKRKTHKGSKCCGCPYKAQCLKNDRADCGKKR